MIRKITRMPRHFKKALLIFADTGLLYFSLWAAFYIRLEQIWPEGLAKNLTILTIAPLITIPVYYFLGMYSAVIRHLGPKFVGTMTKACTVASLLLALLVVMTRAENVPRSVFIIYAFNIAILAGGIRMLARLILPLNPSTDETTKKKVALYGAGAAGTQIAKALVSSQEYQPILFLDDSQELQGWELQGLRVYPPQKLPTLIKKHQLQEVILCMPSQSRVAQRRILESLESLPIMVKTLPGIPNILDGKVQVDDIREVQIEDLLGRDPVAPNPQLMAACITDKVVMVTGAGGSIGSELARQIAAYKPAKLVLFEHNEYSLYSIHRELVQNYGSLKIVPVLGSVTSRKDISRCLRQHKVASLYHAAAYKHVPMVEENVLQGIYNNALGTLNTALASLEAGLEVFILISTDKAVRPTSVMGATKRFAELILQALQMQTDRTIFTMVRFGNVLGSSGSVVPLFKKQIREGGPVTVTHPKMTRFFMTIPEAAQLVIQAGAMGKGGDVFVLDMGNPIRILDLAKKMIWLSGLTVTGEDDKPGDIEIQFSGIRPGEKLYEELLIGENVFPTNHPRIMRAEESKISWQQIQAFLAQLEKAIDEDDSDSARKTLNQAIPSFNQIDYEKIEPNTPPKPRPIFRITEEIPANNPLGRPATSQAT